MRLNEIHIENFRSLAAVHLEDLSQFNVLVGRNNSGKSSVFNFLRLLAIDLAAQSGVYGVGWEGWSNVHPNADEGRVLSSKLKFTLDTSERHILFSQHLGPDYGDRIGALVESDLIKYFTIIMQYDSTHRRVFLTQATSIAEDGKTFIFYSSEGYFKNPLYGHPVDVYSAHNIENSAAIQYVSSKTELLQVLFQQNGTVPYLMKAAVDFLYRSFFFQPVRKSSDVLPVAEKNDLATDGSDLVQVLHTLHSNKSQAFRQVEIFIQAALPDVGHLQTPLTGSMTHAAFQDAQSAFSARLRDMGGGVEQLLLAAIALYAQPINGALFLEEPESHLHPGAQRFLLASLLDTSRQVFLTTHSPTFVNVRDEQLRIYRVTREQGRTSIQPVGPTSSLADALEDLGVRNSDVLLSDAVVFVEGPSDVDVLLALSTTLGVDLTERNLRLLPTGGSADVQTSAPIRSGLLEAVMDQAAVPHLFLLDRDHRNAAELNRLTQRLGNRLHVLARRELENYLLVPGAIRKTLRDLSGSNSALRAHIEDQTDAHIESEIERVLHVAAAGLYGTVLLKRIRNELGGVRGGLLPREATSRLIPQAEAADFVTQLTTAIEQQIAPLTDPARIESIAAQQRAQLDLEWEDIQGRWKIAPGEELLSAVFAHFKANFRKTKSDEQLAKHMTPQEIDPELQEFIRRAADLSPR